MSLMHITIGTADVIQTRDFFKDTLGWEPIDRPNNIATEACWMQIAHGQQLHILHLPKFKGSPEDQEYGRHIAIRYPADGFAQLKERISERGGVLIPPSRETPFERFFFRDPNGVCFEVIDSNAKPEAGT